MADLQNPSDTTGRLIAASTVTGTSVFDTAAEKLGSIYDLMLDKSTGKAEYAIMNFGGLFGIGEKYHPLPWHVLRYDPALGGYVVSLDRKQLENGPAYEMSENTWGDDSWGSRVNDYYGSPTHDDLVNSPIANPALGGRAPLI